MREIILSSCTSDSPLAQQLTENIPGFNWHRDQNGPLVTKVTEAFLEYPFAGSMKVDDGTCGFCGKERIAVEYYFRWPGSKPRPVVETRYGDDAYRIVLPSLLTTGSKCREFPRVAEFVRENLNNVFVGIQYDYPRQDGLLVLSKARLHPKLDVDDVRCKMLHIPLNMITYDERYPLMDTLCSEYEFFVFARRKTFPKDMKAICDHRNTKGRIPKWYPRDAYRYEDEDIVLGIPMSEVIRRGRIL